MTMRSMTTAAAALAVAGALAGCSGMREGAGGTASNRAASAVANLRTADGSDVGTAVAMVENGGVRVSIDGKSLPHGAHGAHVHTVGRCDAPDFASAGGHWNPTGMQHGMRNPAGPHGGDMPNLMVASDGRGTLSMMLPSGSLDAMLDGDGAAMMIHASADDLVSDPSGNSGGRIACGVFVRR